MAIFVSGGHLNIDMKERSESVRHAKIQQMLVGKLSNTDK